MLQEYINEKICILRQLGIKLNAEQRNHIKNLKSQIAVDNFARSLILPHEPYNIIT